MARGLTIVFALFCLLVTAGGAVADSGSTDASGRRVALVVGNSHYSLAQLALGNPKNDAEDVGGALKALGFDVITSTDLSLAAFDAAVHDFKKKAQGAEVALFFYAGHAVQSDHVNYFIPVDADITQEAQLKRMAVSIADIQDALAGVQGVQVMILDSCRDNPFSSLKLATRGIGDGGATRGLERIVVSSGDSVVLYSTRANDVASDGAPGARNSPFSRVLVDVLKRPGEHDLRSMLWDVAAKVKAESSGKQSPELTMSLSGDYTFNLVNDRLEWETIRTSLDPKVYRTYAARFPLSPFRKQAELYAGKLEEQEQLRHREAEERTRKDTEIRLAKEQADRAEKVCWENYQRLDLLKAGADQAGLEALQRQNSCAKMQESIDGALAAVVAARQKQTCDRLEGELGAFAQSRNAAGLTAIQPEAAACAGLSDRIAQAAGDIQTAERQQREAEEQQRLAAAREREAERQQAECDADAGQLQALTSGKGPRRTDEIAALADAARCDAVRAQARTVADDFRRQDAQAAHDARQKVACAAETKTMQDAMAGGPRAAIEALGRSHLCETLDVPGALAQYDDRAEKRRQQAICDDEGARLKALSGGQGGRRSDAVAALGAAARCGTVRDRALALADDLRRQEAQAAHDAAQRLACAAETKTVHDAVAGGPRAAIEALGQSHQCETLDVPGALAQYDDRAAKRQQAICDGEEARLKALAGGQDARRSDAVAALGAAAQCGPVRNEALALAQDLRRQDAQAAHDAAQRLACAAETKTVRDAIAGGPRAAIEALERSHGCETLDLPGALAQYDDRAEKRRQASCDDEGARLQALAGGQGARRIDDIATLGAAAQCGTVRDRALALADDLRHQEAQAARDGAQRVACTAETQTVREAVASGNRAAIEALGPSHRCETLDVPGALAQFDIVLDKRRQEALKTCAAIDVAGFGERQDDKALADLLAKCPSRSDDIAAAQKAIADGRRLAEACRREGDQLQRLVGARQQGAVLDLQKQATCPTLDVTGALAAITSANCANGVKAVGGLRDDDEAGLRNAAGNSGLCPEAQTAARQRLDRLDTARRDDDAACEQNIADASSSGDVARLKSLLRQEVCARRHEAVARALDDQQKAEQERLAAAACDRGVAAVGHLAEGDEQGLRRVAGDDTLCPRARQQAVARLDRIETARRDDATCDQQISAASGRGDLGQLKGLLQQEACVRRHDAVARAIGDQQRAEQDRLAAATCDHGVAAVGQVVDGDEAALRRLAGDETLCPPARRQAKARLQQIETARRDDDATCDRSIADASGRGDLDQLTRLSTQEGCVRRRDVIARAIDDQNKKVAAALQAKTACDNALAAVALVSLDDDAALHHFADDGAACPAVRTAAIARLGQAVAARDAADRACDTAVATAASGGDVEGVTRLSADPGCARRRGVVAKALGDAVKARVRSAQADLTRLHCYRGDSTGTFDDATRQAIARYRKARQEGGPAPTAFTLDFINELTGQTAPVCVQEAAIEPPETPASPVVPGPTAPPKPKSPARQHPPHNAEPAQPKPPQRSHPPMPSYVRPPKIATHPAPTYRPPPPPQDTGQSSSPKGHIFY